MRVANAFISTSTLYPLSDCFHVLVEALFRLLLLDSTLNSYHKLLMVRAANIHAVANRV